MRAYGGMGYSGEIDRGDRLRGLIGLRIAGRMTDIMRMDVAQQRNGDQFWDMAVTGE